MAVLVGVILLSGASVLSAVAQEAFPPVDQPGVTATQIKVGGVASKVAGGGLKPVFDKPGKPFLCFTKPPAKLTPPTNR